MAQTCGPKIQRPAGTRDWSLRIWWWCPRWRGAPGRGRCGDRHCVADLPGGELGRGSHNDAPAGYRRWQTLCSRVHSSSRCPPRQSTHPGGSRDERVLAQAVLTTLGVDFPKTAKILDFGCGEGNTLGALLRLGHVNADFRPMRQLITTRLLPAAQEARRSIGSPGFFIASSCVAAAVASGACQVCVRKLRRPTRRSPRRS